MAVVQVSLVLSVLATVAGKNNVITIGYLTNITGRKNAQRQGLVVSGALALAVERVNANSSLIPGFTLKFIYNDTGGEPLAGTRALVNQWRAGVAAIIGPEDSCHVEATVAAALNLPMISYKCADSKVSSKEFYSTFARTSPPDTAVVTSIIALIQYYSWTKFTLVVENAPQFQTIVQNLESQLPKNYTISYKKSFENFYYCCENKISCCINPFVNIVEHTFSKTRVYVFMGGILDMIKMLLVMQMKGLFDRGEYVVVFIDLDFYDQIQPYKYFWHPDLTVTDQRAAQEAAQSLLIIVPSPPHHREYADFERKVREYNKKPPFVFPQPLKPSFEIHVTMIASYLYDAVMLYARALHEQLKANLDPHDGYTIIRRIVGFKKFESVTGSWMTIDQNGDVSGNYTVLARYPLPPQLKPVEHPKEGPTFAMLPVGRFFHDDQLDRPIFRKERAIPWVGKGAPLAEPPCGFDGSDCKPPPDKNREIIAAFLGITLIVVAIVSALIYWNWKYEKEIAGLLWKISLSSIEFSNNAMNPFTESRASSMVSLESRGGFSTQIFTQTALYRGSYVAVKKLQLDPRYVDVTRKTKKEMRLMRELRHDNVNKFIGACVEPKCLYIISEYCSKGSLQDILENDAIKLDKMFIASLIFDLIKGMIYLHNSDIEVHGNLKSSNCVVTARWSLQVTDFGLQKLRMASKLCTLSGEEYYRSLLWTAPELLASGRRVVTQKGDVYSFAIILHEILTRQGPFGKCELSPQEIIEGVQGERALRPSLEGVECQDYVRQVLLECWSTLPEDRPDFRRIRQRMQRLRQGLKPNIMDNLMSLMEKYTNNLEELVDERTAQLVEEQKKTEALLHRMLPRSVAAQLMRGEPVVPEAYDAVTVYFSDIVGFTEMCAHSSPLEVVRFLNELYSVFDSIIGNYDVYKVETIGDAYMVVSGLPIRNGEQHSAEIATMALELREAVYAFRIPHRLGQILRLRIGIHTGA